MSRAARILHRSRLRSRGALAVAVAVVASWSLTGCALACTEAGYVNTLTVRITGEAPSEMAGIELCAEAGCVDGVRGGAGGEWTFALFVSAPRHPRIIARDAARTVVAVWVPDVEWRATSEPNGPGCDNRSTAAPLTLDASTSQP